MRLLVKPVVLPVLLALAVLPLLPACLAPPSVAAPGASMLRCTAQTTSRLYFGMDSPDGPVSDATWQDFIDREITPRLPDGFTWWAAKGQWRGKDGAIGREDSRVLEVVAPNSVLLRQTLAEIAGRYKTRFRQQVVLVTQGDARVCE
jgi:Protein of unknown function (DUF3574)